MSLIVCTEVIVVVVVLLVGVDVNLLAALLVVVWPVGALWVVAV